MRYRNRTWCEMMKSIKLSSDQTSEIVLYHKVKRIFLNLMDIEKKIQCGRVIALEC